MGKITKKELVAAYKELDKVVGGVEPAINHDELTADEFEKELYETVNDLVEEDDEFSEKTQKVFDYLAEKYGDAEEEEDEAEEEEDEAEEEAEDDEAEEEAEDDEEEEPEPEPVKKGKAKKEAPVPAPKKGKAKPEPEPEEDDEDDDEEAEEEDLASVVKSTMKKDALHDLINENVEFKKKRKELLAEKSVFTLKKMMLDILGGGAPKAKVEKEPVKKEKPAKKEKEKVFSRMDALLLTMKNNPKASPETIVKKADELYKEKTGKPGQPTDTRNRYDRAILVLEFFGHKL